MQEKTMRPGMDVPTRCVAVAPLIVCAVLAQTEPDPPAFDVASVKRPPAKVAAVAVVLAVLGAAAAAEQPPAQKLEAGIYMQTHYGDDDGAIRLYREVVAGGGDRALAGLAQMQIVSALLNKGDFAAAAQEFKTLVTNYADQEGLMASLTKRLSGAQTVESAPSAPPLLTRGTLQNGVYHLNSIGTEIALPPGWTVTGDQGTDGVSDNIFFQDQKTNFSVAMYLAPLTTADKVGDVDATLRAMMDSKVKERIMQGATDFELLPETVKPWLVQGRHALSAIGQSSRGGGPKRYGYFAYVCGVESYVFILGSAPTGRIPSYRDRVERLVAGTRVP
jgi:hypothetical protein